MRRYLSCLFALVAIGGLTPDCDAALVISEIMSRPSGGASTEWFELFNSGGTSVNLSTIRFDDAANASAGTTLSGTLATGKYAIITAQSSAAWTARYGALPSGASIVTVSKSRWDLGNGSDRLTLYNTVTASNFFSLTYGASTTGRSLQYTGTSSGSVSPYVFAAGRWQNATSSPGGSSGNFHNAGQSNLQAAPEPAAWAMIGLAGLSMITVVRRQRHTQQATSVS